MEFILDKSSIELFYDDGISVMTEIFFSNSPYETLSFKLFRLRIKFEKIQTPRNKNGINNFKLVEYPC